MPVFPADEQQEVQLFEDRPRRRGAAGAALAAVFVLSTAAVLLVGRDPTAIPSSRWVESAVLVVVVIAAIACRHARPAVAVVAIVIAQVTGFAVGQPGEAFTAAVGVYTAAASRSTAAGARLAGLVLAVVSLGIAISRIVLGDGISEVRAGLADLLWWAVVIGGALLIGALVGNRRRYVAAIVERTRQLADERDRSANLARVAERARIAREMHDVLSHNLQVIVSAADAALAVADRDPSTSREMVETIADSARRSMREARLVFAMLRDSPATDDALGSTVEDLDGVVERMRVAGLRITFEEVGDAGDDPQRRLAVQRIVQESLTNSLRHAGTDAVVDVVVRHSTDGSEIEVVDEGPGPAALEKSVSSGQGVGIAGMRERATVLGGWVTAGRRADAPGWRVSARIPNGPAAAGGEAAR